MVMVSTFPLLWVLPNAQPLLELSELLLLVVVLWGGGQFVRA